MSILKSKRRRLLAGIIEEVKNGKWELLTITLATFIGAIVGAYIIIVFFYLTGK